MNVTVYVPKDLESSVRAHAKAEGTTPSLLIQRVLREALTTKRRTFSPQFEALAGAWQDTRKADEIFEDIRLHRLSSRRPRLR